MPDGRGLDLTIKREIAERLIRVGYTSVSEAVGAEHRNRTAG
ncbi:MAG: hypothetical protein O3B74_00455 [Proteobacteria bacterium]|nr:hypothetical protein [Pseudomonadota bacterium]MDA1308387.1 hypothetical protein [Pseudomonadota bacterium]